MKTTIDTLKRGSAVLGAVLCATMGLSAFGAVDITDFVRSCGTGNYHVRCGNGTKSYASVDTAFDGVTSGGDSSPDTRTLLCTTNSGGATIPTPVSVLYYIDEGVLSHYDFKVTAFTLYRLMSGYNYLNRSPTEFELQGYDGSQWHSLFRTDETHKYAYCAVRQGELWWHDFNFFVKTVEKLGMRPWIWSDYIWGHRDEFLKRMPKSVMQSNWYYRQWFDFKTIPKERKAHLESFLALDKAGFDQIPCGSNWACDENIAGLVRFCRKNIAPERLKGFLMTTWGGTLPSCEAKLEKGIDLAADAWA